MNVEMRKGGRVQSNIAILVYGCQGAGKSTFALNSAYLKRTDGKPFRVLYIDNERGSIDDYLDSLEDDGINLDNILVAYTSSFDEVINLIKTAKDKKPFYDGDKAVITDADGEQFVPDMIVVDGTSLLYKTIVQSTVEFSKRRAVVRAGKKDIDASERAIMVEGSGVELKDYNTINAKGTNLVLTLTDSGINYIITAREQEEFDTKIIKDINGSEKEVRVSTGKFKPEGFKDPGYNTKTEIRLFRDQEDDPTVKAFVKKDRTGVYKPFSVIEDPSILSFQIVVDKSNGRKKVSYGASWDEDIKKEVEKKMQESVGFSIENGEPIDETKAVGIEQKRKLAREIVDGLSRVQKDKLKGELAAVNLSPNVTKIIEISDMDKYIELAKSVKE